MVSRRTRSLLVQAAVLALHLAPAGNAHAGDAMTECIGENERSLELRKAGKLLDARREIAACSSAACPDAIQLACRGRIAELNAAIPSIVFDVKDAAGQDLLDVQLSIDGQPAGTVGVAARQVDPGRHVFRFLIAERAPVEKVLILREGEKERHEAIVVGGGAAASAPATNVDAEPTPRAAAAGSGRNATASSASSATSSSGLRTAGWIVGGAGIVTMAVGGALGLVAKSSYDGVAGCTGNVCTTKAGADASNSARDTGNIATVVFVAGLAATAVGVVLWIVAPTSHDAASVPAWRAGLTPAGLLAEGRF